MNPAERGASRLLFFIPILVFILGCNTEKPDKQGDNRKKYSIYAMMKDGKEYISQVDSIASGNLNPSQGAKVVPTPLYYDLIVRDGHYYRVDRKTSRFIKITIVNNVFTEESSLQLDGFNNLENYNWISADSILLIGGDATMQKVRFAKVNVKEMFAVQGSLPIPSPFGTFNSMSVGFSKFDNDRLLVGYTYHTTHALKGYTTSDTIYTEVLHYPGMKSIGRMKDTRSAYPGGFTTNQSHDFTDEHGDFYFIACPGIALGNNPGKPTAIFRIKKGESHIDPDYFFNISASPIRNHGYGLWFIGDGKAIVRTERQGLFTGMKDHYRVPQMDFFVVDLATKSTNRLNLPLDKGTARQCVLVENGLVYITVNSDAEGSYVWIYDPKSGALRKGLKFKGDVDYILRLERLN